MYFQTLQSRLLESIRMKVRTGELTERGLARLTGISQPHIHNVLKGIRDLSPQIADLILQELKISLLDLVEHEELAARVSMRYPQRRFREVPLLDGRIGPGWPFPERLNPVECYPFSGALLACLVRPVAARLADDPRMRPTVAGGDLVLLDQSENLRREIDADTLYAVSFGGQSLVRWVRQGARAIYLASSDTFLRPQQWDHVELSGWRVLDVVKARVVWIGRETGPVISQERPTTSR